MKYDKRKALNVIISSAKIFDEKLRDRELLFISKQDKIIIFYEIRFVGSNFKHFTGRYKEIHKSYEPDCRNFV